MKRKLTIILAGLICLGMNPVKAQTPFNPTTYSGWLSTPNNYFASLPACSGLTFNQPLRGAGNQFSTSTDGINSGQWQNVSSADAIAANRYFTFSITANSSTAFQIDSLLLVLGRSGTGPDSCILQYKSPATGYTFVSVTPTTYIILNPTTDPTTSIRVIPSASMAVSPSDSIVFRLVAWHASSSLGKMRMVNNTAVYGSSIIPQSNTIEAPLVQTTNGLCVSPVQGDSVQVTFNSTGTFNSGNSYLLELSDASGSFAAPLTIGSINSQLNTGTIAGFIPAGTLNASYRLRVRSSDPAVNGLDTTDLNINPGIVLGASVLQPNCPDSTGSIDLTISGGSGTIQYTWSNGALTQDISGFAGGILDVIIMDGVGCSADSSFQIFPVSSFLITETIEHATCHSGTDGQISVIVTGGTAPYTISWNGNGTNQTGVIASDLPAGNYDLTITDANNCLYTDAYTVTEPTSLSVSALVTNATCATCTGTVSLVVSGGTGPYTYNWTNNTILSQISATPGNYCVEISDANNCTIDSCFVITSTAGIETMMEFVLNVFPNPASESVHIDFSTDLQGVSKNVSILDLYGKVVYKISLSGEMNQVEIPLKEWSNGTYTYLITIENEIPRSGKIVVYH